LYDQQIIRTRAEKSELINKIPTLHQSDIVQRSIENYCKSVKVKLEKYTDLEYKRQLLLDCITKIIYIKGKMILYGSIPILLDAYTDPDQTSDASKIEFSIQTNIASTK